jgi:hypothetical protein
MDHGALRIVTHGGMPAGDAFLRGLLSQQVDIGQHGECIRAAPDHRVMVELLRVQPEGGIAVAHDQDERRVGAEPGIVAGRFIGFQQHGRVGRLGGFTGQHLTAAGSLPGGAARAVLLVACFPLPHHLHQLGAQQGVQALDIVADEFQCLDRGHALAPQLAVQIVNRLNGGHAGLSKQPASGAGQWHCGHQFHCVERPNRRQAGARQLFVNSPVSGNIDRKTGAVNRYIRILTT